MGEKELRTGRQQQDVAVFVPGATSGRAHHGKVRGIRARARARTAVSLVVFGPLACPLAKLLPRFRGRLLSTLGALTLGKKTG